MLTGQQAIVGFLTAVMVDIKRTQEEKGIIASGKSAESLQVLESEGGASLTGDGSFFFQDQGRKPGKLPPILNIMAWLKAKGLNYNPWAVAVKQAQDGTRIFQDKKKGLQLDKIVMANKKEFLTAVAKQIGQDVLQEIKKSTIKFKPSM